MAQADLYIPFNVEQAIATFNLVRGIESTYDASIYFPAGTTDFYLVSTATGVSIDQSTGIITANWGHAYGVGSTSATFRVSDTIGTGGLNVDIPVTVRDWFPADFQALHEFFSMKRSHNGESGVALFDYQLREGLPPSDIFTGGTIQSGADGYANLTPLDSVRNGVIIEVTNLYDQVSGTALPKVNSNVGHGSIGYVTTQGNLVLYETPNGHLRLRTDWNAQDIAASFAAHTVNATEFEGTLTDYDLNWAMGFEVRRRGSTGDDAQVRIGDGNAYPSGFSVSSSSTDYRFGTKNRPSNVSIGTDEAREWLLWTGYRMRNPDDATQFRARHAVYGLEAEDTQRYQNLSTQNHAGDAITHLEFTRYDFSEFFVYAFDDAQSETIWQDGGRLDYVNNAVVVTGDETHQYGVNT